MQSKLNIFNSLPQHASDSEDEVTAKNAKTKIRHEKQAERKQDSNKGHHGNAAPRNPGQKEDVSRTNQGHKTKGVTAEPHPQDRQSGTGHQAYGNKPKKSGAGKGNWGNYKEDKNREDVPEGEESPEVQEEEKPEGKTLSEYLASRQGVSSKPQVNEAKAKITSDQLVKELGKATALKTRTQQEIDDKRVGKKKGNLDVNHHAGINTDHSDLLNFRTGFVEKEYKERVRGEEQPRERRQFGDRKRREEEPATEGEKTETAAPVEGEKTETPVEGEAKPKTDAPQGERRQGQGNRGGYKPKGDRPQGDRPHGDRPHGNRPHKAHTPKVNFEDESLFPKLG